MKHTALLLLLSALAAAEHKSCSSGFHLVGNYCYRFSSEFSETKSWDQARSFCQMLDSDLAVLDLDCNDNQHLLSYIITQDYTSIWVGASDTTVEGVWTWIDDRPVDMRSPMWYYSEPTNPSSNDCARLLRSSSDFPRVYLHDYSCTSSLYFICQLGIHSKL